MIAKEVWEQFVEQVRADKRFTVGIGLDVNKNPSYVEIFIVDWRYTPEMVTLMVKDMLGPEADIEVLPGLHHTVHVRAPVVG